VVVVVAGGRVVVVVAATVEVVVVAGGRVVVVVAATVEVVVVAGGRVVVVDGSLVVVVVGRLVGCVVVVVPRCRHSRRFRSIGPGVLLDVMGLPLASEEMPPGRGLTVAPEVLATVKELPSTASATAMTTPPARARRRRIGEAL
jgi:hypothetical protein